METKKEILYPNKTKEEIEAVVNDVMKDYKDPTENMSIEDKIRFNEAMKKMANKMIVKLEK